MSSAIQPLIDRRNDEDRYYAIRADVKYRVMDGTIVVDSGTGRARTMSGKRLVFDSDKSVRPGSVIEVSLAWPALLENRIPLKLVIKGRTAMWQESVVVDILRYEFRTQAVHSGAVVQTALPPPIDIRGPLGRDCCK